MAERVYKSFKEFYPYYLTEHSKRGTRITHFIGTTLFILMVLYSLVTGNGWLFLMGVVLAYGWAWIGHFFIEKNKPATFQYPLWSWATDFKLYSQILGGKEGFTAK